MPLRTRRITFGALFRRLADRSFTVTFPRPDLVVLFFEPASRAVPVSFAALELGDPGWVASHAAATCPECGKSACCGSLLRDEN